MSAFPQYLLPLGAIMIALIAAGAFRRLRRTRRRARVVERPNSHYTAPPVREREARDRWHSMALDRLHEINREEVVRLLARIDAAGAESLRPNERSFLERMAELAG